MSAVYLPIRSFGDLIITASVVKQHALEKIPVILPTYLIDIFNAVGAAEYFDITGNISFKDQPAFFEMYKVRDAKNIVRLAKDITTISGTLKSNTEYLLDYSSRRLLFTGAKLRWPSTQKNIYEAKHALFSKHFNLKPYQPEFGIPAVKKQNTSVLILPDSRIKDKEIDAHLAASIIKYFRNTDIQVARFSKGKKVDGGLQYADFEELLSLITKYDLIISAESLPYHLANYCSKPHFVIYNNSRHFKSTFITPYMQTHGFYAFHEQNNSNSVLTKLEEILF